MPRRRKTEPTRRTLRVERLEDRAMLAGDLELVRDRPARTPSPHQASSRPPGA
ncbi:MAG: hypothetical protein ACRCT8_08920 [Lacipirellulaceae bacterium]